MNNKKIGSAFERELAEMLKDRGYWVHFMAPDARGAQPFDIIAVKDDKPYAIDCKTCERDTITIRRLEYNQIFAFELWKERGNGDPIIAVKHKGRVYFVSYAELSAYGKMALTEDMVFAEVDDGKG